MVNIGGSGEFESGSLKCVSGSLSSILYVFKYKDRCVKLNLAKFSDSKVGMVGWEKASSASRLV